MSQQPYKTDPTQSLKQASNSDYPGLLITFEGIDGAGKTELIGRIKTDLESKGHRAVVTKEPGGTRIGKMLKKVLLEEEKECEPRVEYLLFAADRAEHFARLVIPELKKGTIVLSDRMADSAVAYQGYGRGLDISLIKTVNAWAMCSLVPDATLYLKISVDESFKRRAARSGSSDAMEREGDAFWHRVSAGYDTLSQSRETFHTIDGHQSRDDVFAHARAIIQNALAAKNEKES